MVLDVSSQSLKPSIGYGILKWIAFGSEILLLCLLLVFTFMVPVPPFRYGKTPHEALLVAISAAVSLGVGALFTRNSKSSTMSLGNLISSPPCVIGLTVIAIVAIPMGIGFARGLLFPDAY